MQAGSEWSRQAWRHIGSQRGEVTAKEVEEKVQQIRWESLVRPGRGQRRCATENPFRTLHFTEGHFGVCVVVQWRKLLCERGVPRSAAPPSLFPLERPLPFLPLPTSLGSDETEPRVLLEKLRVQMR